MQNTKILLSGLLLLDDFIAIITKIIIFACVSSHFSKEECYHLKANKKSPELISAADLASYSSTRTNDSAARTNKG